MIGLNEISVDSPRQEKSSDDSMLKYFRDINQYKLLTRQEEIEYATQYRQNEDQKAAYKLVVSNLRLVVKIAFDFRKMSSKNLLDLIQEGNIGLIKAVEKYNPDKNVKFSYYASFWIRAYILKSIMENYSLVRIGKTHAQRKLFFNLKKEKQKLIKDEITPRPSLIAKNLGVEEQDVIEMDQHLNQMDISLNNTLNDDSDSERIDFLVANAPSPEQDTQNREIVFLLRKYIDDFKQTLSEREKDIIDHRILADNPLTLRELGKQHGISKERVRQIETSIKSDFKHFFIKKIRGIDSEGDNEPSE